MSINTWNGYNSISGATEILVLVADDITTPNWKMGQLFQSKMYKIFYSSDQNNAIKFTVKRLGLFRYRIVKIILLMITLSQMNSCNEPYFLNTLHYLFDMWSPYIPPHTCTYICSRHLCISRRSCMASLHTRWYLNWNCVHIQNCWFC